MLILLAFVNLPLNVSAERHEPRAGPNRLQEALGVPANRNSLARVKGSGQLTWLRAYHVLASGAAIQEANRFYRYGPPASVDGLYDDCIYTKLSAPHPQQADPGLLNAPRRGDDLHSGSSASPPLEPAPDNAPAPRAIPLMPRPRAHQSALTSPCLPRPGVPRAHQHHCMHSSYGLPVHCSQYSHRQSRQSAQSRPRVSHSSHAKSISPSICRHCSTEPGGSREVSSRFTHITPTMMPARASSTKTQNSPESYMGRSGRRNLGVSSGRTAPQRPQTPSPNPLFSPHSGQIHVSATVGS